MDLAHKADWSTLIPEYKLLSLAVARMVKSEPTTTNNILSHLIHWC